MVPRIGPLSQLFSLALLLAHSLLAFSSDSALDLCKRQPFRGRCPPGPNGVQMRSQFVLRYYLRNGECISYPYGHCVSDENEPRLFRYKEECEDACLGKEGAREATYATVGPAAPKDVEPTEPEKTAATSTEGPRTECQRQRQKARQGGGGHGQALVRGAFVPECTLSGTFVPLQCEPGGAECFCVDAEGIELKHSRAKGPQKPDCEKIASAPAARTNECTGPALPGPCIAFTERWFFDEQRHHCAPFNYSGCGGNGNNYASQQACEQRCKTEAKCGGAEQPLKDAKGELVDCAGGPGTCPTGFLCHNIQGASICCPDTRKEKLGQPPAEAGEAAGLLVSDKERPPEAGPEHCALPKDRGPCDQYQMRFYFNRELGECKYFFFGGCEGNANNFARVEDCERACIRGKSNAPEQPAPTSEFSTTTTTTAPIQSVDPQHPQQQQANTPTLTPSQLPSRRNITTSSTPPAVMLPSNRCQHPKDKGECAAQFVRWYWNGEARNCEQFTYGGCNGNGNNFGSREECLSICHREVVPPTEKDPQLAEVCESDIDEGQCGALFMRYAFDRKTGECRPFQYGGCGGNGNNFASLADCKRRCVPPEPETLSNNICEHRIDPGECSGVFHRFGYDPQSNKCNQFVYGGCGGNGNNFASEPDCQVACVRPACPQPEPTECDLARCQLVKDARGCVLCSCAPPRHPPLVTGLSSGPRPQCPPLDVQLCVEPCIIFLNRKGCQECVCPILPPTQAPPTDNSESGTDEQQSISVSPGQPPSPPAPPAPAHKFFEVIQHGLPNTVPGLASLAPPTAPPSQPPPAPLPTAPSAPPPPSQPISPTQRHQPESGLPGSNAVVAFGNNEICSQILDPGAVACTRFVQRWYFNVQRAQCESFTYTGCAGNRNHFFSQKECQIYCGRFSRTGTSPPLDGDAVEPGSAASQAPAPALSKLPEKGEQIKGEKKQGEEENNRVPVKLVEGGGGEEGEGEEEERKKEERRRKEEEDAEEEKRKKKKDEEEAEEKRRKKVRDEEEEERRKDAEETATSRGTTTESTTARSTKKVELTSTMETKEEEEGTTTKTEGEEVEGRREEEPEEEEGKKGEDEEEERRGMKKEQQGREVQTESQVEEGVRKEMVVEEIEQRVDEGKKRGRTEEEEDQRKNGMKKPEAEETTVSPASAPHSNAQREKEEGGGIEGRGKNIEEEERGKKNGSEREEKNQGRAPEGSRAGGRLKIQTISLAPDEGKKDEGRGGGRKEGDEGRRGGRGPGRVVTIDVGGGGQEGREKQQPVQVQAGGVQIEPEGGKKEEKGRGGMKKGDENKEDDDRMWLEKGEEGRKKTRDEERKEEQRRKKTKEDEERMKKRKDEEAEEQREKQRKKLEETAAELGAGKGEEGGDEEVYLEPKGGLVNNGRGGERKKGEEEDESGRAGGELIQKVEDRGKKEEEDEDEGEEEEGKEGSKQNTIIRKNEQVEGGGGKEKKEQKEDETEGKEDDVEDDDDTDEGGGEGDEDEDEADERTGRKGQQRKEGDGDEESEKEKIRGRTQNGGTEQKAEGREPQQIDTTQLPVAKETAPPTNNTAPRHPMQAFQPQMPREPQFQAPPPLQALFPQFVPPNAQPPPPSPSSSSSPSLPSLPNPPASSLPAGEGALSNLFTAHHIQQQVAGGGGGGTTEIGGAGEVARKMVPVGGELIEDSARLQPITREEDGGGGEDKRNRGAEEASSNPSMPVISPPAASSALPPGPSPVPELVPFAASSSSSIPPPSSTPSPAQMHSSAASGQHQTLPERCSLERDEGAGGGYNVQWYFNVRNLRCEQFVWQGQAGNENRFGTSQECEAVCKFSQVPGLLRPVNVVPPPVRAPAFLPAPPHVPEIGAVQEDGEPGTEDRGQEADRTEDNNELTLAKGAAIAQTGDGQGAVGMPAPVQAIGEMPAAPEPPPGPGGYSSYQAVPLPKVPPKLPDNLPPMLGPSPPAVIDYQTGKRFDQPKDGGASATAAGAPTVQQGLPNHVPPSKEIGQTAEKDQKGFGDFSSVLDNFPQPSSRELAQQQQHAKPPMPGMPVCPNGLNAMQYSDGRPVMCLPGRNQCPNKSVCFFNGLDYFCCPNEDDPYDQHVFGGYDGEELKHGYKNQPPNNLFFRRRHLHHRQRRGAVPPIAFSVDSDHSLRFDDKAPPSRINQAVFRQHNLLHPSGSSPADMGPCVQPLRKGNCQEARLRYFYDPSLDQCRLFYYSGCDGNQNNFATLPECEMNCKIGIVPSSTVSPAPKLGPCPGGELPLGGKNPVLCGDRFDSIGCPSGYFCAAGPPSVCCAGTGKELRRKQATGQQEVRPSDDLTTGVAQSQDLAPYCPDGSEPMKNASSGELVVCGSGPEWDGKKMCQPGHYCSMNHEQNLRMCCPLNSQASQVPSSGELLAPHFGIRAANPGEVVDKGSLPFERRGARPVGGMRRKDDLPSQVEPGSPTGTAQTEFGHLVIGGRKGTMEEAEPQSKLVEPREDVSAEDPFDMNRSAKKGGSVCRLRPTEGRLCRDDEPSPPSHLQYFFDPKERKCKVFFHRGCGGNANRFDSRQQCEGRCGGPRRGSRS